MYQTEEPNMTRSAPASPVRSLPCNDTKRMSPSRSPRRISHLPSPTSKLLSINNEGSPAEEEEYLDAELNRYGYVVTDRMIVLEDGNALTRYIVARSPDGDNVVVNLDTDGFVAIDAEPKIYMPSMGVHQDALEDNVADICDNGMCIRTVDGRVLNVASSNHASVGNRRASYPMVDMSSIRKSPRDASAAIQSQGGNITAHSFNESMAVNSELYKDISGLVGSHKNYIDAYKRALANRSDDIKQLEGYRSIYSRMPTLTPQDQKKYSLTLKILEDRKAERIELLSQASEVSAMDAQIRELNKRISNMTSSLTSKAPTRGTV